MPSEIAVEKKKLKNPPLELHYLGDRVLRQPAKRITKIDDELRQLVREMLQTMYSKDGIGLAAPQVKLCTAKMALVWLHRKLEFINNSLSLT